MSPDLDHLSRLFPISDNLHLGLALSFTVPDGQGKVSCLIALQDVGFSTTPGEDVLEGSTEAQLLASILLTGWGGRGGVLGGGIQSPLLPQFQLQASRALASPYRLQFGSPISAIVGATSELYFVVNGMVRNKYMRDG